MGLFIKLAENINGRQAAVNDSVPRIIFDELNFLKVDNVFESINPFAGQMEAEMECKFYKNSFILWLLSSCWSGKN